MPNSENTVVAEIANEEPIGSLVVKQDVQLTKAIYGTVALLESFKEKADSLVIKKAEDKQTVTDMIRQVKEACGPIIEMIEPIKRQANEKVAKILDVEKAFVTYVTPKEAPKIRADVRFKGWQVIDVLTTKLNAFLDWEDEERMKEEIRLQADAEKKRQKDLDRINKSLDGILDKVSDLNDQKRILSDRLENNPESVTVEEAEEIRARIDAINIKLRPLQDKVVDTQIRMEQKAAPVSVSVDKGVKVAGLSSDNFYWDVKEVFNVKAICRQIAEGTLSPACVTVNQAKIKQAGNDQVKGTQQTPSISGVTFEKKRRISVK